VHWTARLKSLSDVVCVDVVMVTYRRSGIGGGWDGMRRDRPRWECFRPEPAHGELCVVQRDVVEVEAWVSREKSFDQKWLFSNAAMMRKSIKRWRPRIQGLAKAEVSFRQFKGC
jgi:hypothetical protein